MSKKDQVLQFLADSLLLGFLGFSLKAESLLFSLWWLSMFSDLVFSWNFEVKGFVSYVVFHRFM